MTQGERAFYALRLKQERQLARVHGCPQARELHGQWAKFFDMRLDGKRAAPPLSVAA